jgi:DNA modification methylase
MCGDSLSLIDVNKLMDGQKAEMICTDPPYGVNYIPQERRKGGRRVKQFGPLIGDQGFDRGGISSVQLLELIDTGIVKGAVYLWCGTNQIGDIYPWLYKRFKRRPTILIWAKNGFSILVRDYKSAWECAFYYYYERKFRGGDNQDDLWFVKRRATSKYVHSTQKPVVLMQKAIINSSDPGDIVLDLFGGSGSTMIACENTDRRCYMMEIDPKYTEIIINRWEALTGLKAIKLEENKFRGGA